MRAAALVLIPALVGLSEPAQAADPPGTTTAADALTAIQRGVEFLLEDQNSDGSWGGPREAVYTFTGPVWSNPETHRSWKVATTGLCCLALQVASKSDDQLAAYDRGIDYLLDNAMVKRPSDWDTDNTWAYVYGVQAMARAYANPRYQGSEQRARIREVAQWLIERLAAYQTPDGGWGYYDFKATTKRPSWATSFMTAAGIIALLDARQAGLEVDEAVLRRAVRAVERCRLPSGAYTYSVQAIADPRHSEWIDQVKGSLGRIQVCNLALLLAGKDIRERRLKVGLEQLFRHHRFLDIARNKPIPHEAYYLNSGYFYLFGHYYAARLIRQLPEADRDKYWPRLRYEVAKLQQRDGSMWDFDMHAYDKPYGVAFGLLALAGSVEDARTVSPPATTQPAAGAASDK
ncbi:MAG: hypothetical protein ACE5I3_08605 [Phycisphaerae bacterium]